MAATKNKRKISSPNIGEGKIKNNHQRRSSVAVHLGKVPYISPNGDIQSDTSAACVNGFGAVFDKSQAIESR